MKKIISTLVGVSLLFSAFNLSFAEENYAEENSTDTGTQQETELQEIAPWETEDAIDTENISEYSDTPTDEPQNESELPAETETETETEEISETTELTVQSGFTPRFSLSQSDINSKYWAPGKYGSSNGFSRNWSNGGGNCTWYAFGRAWELLGTLPNLCVNNAGKWYSYNKNNGYYPYGSTPKLGAIAVWDHWDNNTGHVAVVEEIGDGYVVFSESGWSLGKTFQTAKRTVTNGVPKYGSSYRFLGYIYILGDSSPATAPVHAHSWRGAYEDAHPHRYYEQCDCGQKAYPGGTRLVGSCSSCYPLGNVSLTRSFNKTGKTATLYRNNVSNANSYSLTVYWNGAVYGTYNMNSKSQYFSNLPSGTYTASLTVRNSNTGQSKKVNCNSFVIVDSYQVTFNANGGNSAPPAQTKIQDIALTLSSAVPVRKHYIFKGWASSKTATTAQYQPGSPYTRNTKITLYAVWEPEVYTIDFDLNGGKGTADSVTITYGNSMKLPNTVVRDGCYLKGWAKTKDATSPNYRIGIEYKFDSNMTLYAIWGNSTWSGTVASSFAGGDGSKDDPYQISNAGELAHLADIVNTQNAAPEYKYYILTDNINLGYNEWVPIGLFSHKNQYFNGSFDGCGYTISDFAISNINEGYLGLFGYAKDSEIKNLTVAGDITGISGDSDSYIGGVVGYGDNINIENCKTLYFNISDISSENSLYVGCICGDLNGGSIKNSETEESYINIKSAKIINIGSVSGYFINGEMTNCTVKSTEELIGINNAEDAYIGGLCGYTNKSAFEACTILSGSLSPNLNLNDGDVGGMIGNAKESTINICSVEFNNGVSKNINSVNYKNSIYSTGGAIGGIIGLSDRDTTITNCKYNGESIITNSDYFTTVGGIVGNSYGIYQTNIGHVKKGETLKIANFPQKSGYFATWYTDPEWTKEYDFSQPVTDENLSLYAKWEKGDKLGYTFWNGTSVEPVYDSSSKTYLISTGEELAWISDVSNEIITTGKNIPDNIAFSGYKIKLTNDIYLNNVSDVDSWETNPPQNIWKSISVKRNNNMFSGTFDGNNYCILGLYCNGERNSKGLFGENAGVIKNLGMDMGYVRPSSVDIGGIAGANWGTISDCYNKMNIINSGASSFAGGICGYNETGNHGTGNIKNCYNTGNVSTAWGCGGISGASTGTIQKCYNSGNISSRRIAGGICGYSYSATITNCYNNGSVHSERSAGGIVGSSFGVTLSYSYNIGQVTASSYVGSIVGELDGGIGTVKYCYGTSTPLYTKNEYYTNGYTITSVSYKSDTAIKSLSNLNGFSTSVWQNDSNNSYPYLKSLYKDEFSVPYYLSDINTPIINKCFVNVNGSIGAFRSNNNLGDAYAGGAIGYHGMLATWAKTAQVKNIIVIADEINSLSNNKNSKAKSGDIIGSRRTFTSIEDDVLWDFDNIYSYSSMNVTATNTANSSNIETSNIASARTLVQLKRASFLKTVFGPDTYQSLEYLKTHPDAVWVIKDGELPELYFNVLNDITVSDTEHGTISVDKEQAVDGELVTVTANASDGYELNKIYVNGKEIVGTTFEVQGDSDIYATFAEKTPEYNVSVAAAENADASLINLDEQGTELSLAEDGGVNSLTATDGDEIKVNTTSDAEYTVDSVYINGEELAGDSFIVNDNSTVTMEVTSIKTDAAAVTRDAANIGTFSATLGGSVTGDNVSRYIRYWKADAPDEIFTTDILEGAGEYSVTVENLDAETEYEYQMTDSGEIKTFTTINTSGYDPYSPNDGDYNPDIPIGNGMAYVIDSVDISDSQTDVEFTQINETDSAVLIVAAYNNDGVCEKTITVDKNDFAAMSEDTYKITCESLKGYKIKCYIWDSLTSQKPLAHAYEQY